MKHRRFAGASLLWALVATTPRMAEAQESPPSSVRNAAAEELFNQGRALLDAGKFAEACVKLAESQRLDPAAGTLLNLADCYEKNGQTASAWVSFREAQRAAVERHRADWERIAERRANALEPKLSQLVVTLAPDADVPGLTISAGKLPVTPAMYATPIPVDPGPLTITMQAPGRVARTKSIVVGPAKDRVHVRIEALELVRAPSADTPARKDRPFPFLPVSLGVGAVVLGAGGAALWVVGRNERSDLQAGCGVTETCAHADVVASRTKLVVGDILVGTGVLSLGAALYFSLTSGPSRAAVSVGPASLRLHAVF